MTATIDVSGLSPEAARAVEALVESLRQPAPPASPQPSVFDLLGTAPNLRTAEDIAGQCREERDSWGGR